MTVNRAVWDATQSCMYGMPPILYIWHPSLSSRTWSLGSALGDTSTPIHSHSQPDLHLSHFFCGCGSGMHAMISCQAGVWRMGNDGLTSGFWLRLATSGTRHFAMPCVRASARINTSLPCAPHLIFLASQNNRKGDHCSTRHCATDDLQQLRRYMHHTYSRGVETLRQRLA